MSAKEQQEVLRELLIGLSGVMDGKEIKVKNKDNLIEGMSSEKVRIDFITIRPIDISHLVN